MGLAVVLGAFASTARADAEKAKQLVAEAEALVTAGDLLGAAAKYRAAYKEEPLPEHICNVGVAYHKAADLPRSHRYLNQCVAMGSSLDPSYRETLRRVVDGIEAKLAAGDFTPIDLALRPASTLVTFEGGKPYDEEIVGGGRIWVPYGTYRLVARAAGHADKTVDVTASSHAAVPLAITLDKAPVELAPTPPVVPPVAPSLERPTVVEVRRSKVPALVGTGATAALAITGLVFYVQARGAIADAEAADITIDRYRELHDDAHGKQRIAWIAGGLAAGAAVISGVLWVRALRSPARVEVTSTGTGVAIRGQF